MRRLIINADDLGINAQRSHGIFQCMEFGVVTNATLIANGADSRAAARHARERGVTVGLHLNLTEDYPLSEKEDIPGLVDMQGVFLGKEKLRAALDENRIERASLEREIRAQVEWILDAYGPPSHVDGHHHIHIHPAVVEILPAILERYGIRFVRIPCELPLPPYGYVINEDQLERTKNLNAMALSAKERFSAEGVGCADHFRGATLVGSASLKNLRHILSRLPEGLTELMVHPGSPITYGTPFDLDPQRQTELRMLLDPSIPELLREKKVTLCSYADL